MEAEYDIKSLTNRLEKFERATDTFLFPETYLAVRMDGHRLGTEWEEVSPEQYPFSPDIREAFLETTQDMFGTDFLIRFAVQHGDEVIVILDKSELNNLRKRTRLTSAMASAAASFFVTNFEKRIIFNAQVSELPSAEHVRDFLYLIKLTAKRNFISRVIQHELGSRGADKKEIADICSNLTEERVKGVFEEINFDLDTVDRGITNATGFYLENKSLNTLQGLPDDIHELGKILNGALGVEDTPKEKPRAKPKGNSNKSRKSKKPAISNQHGKGGRKPLFR